ncbi:hypothetical protein FBEOM_6583 [Fusarium beomiforme]|uniref:Uncharacterized protein n=1 Tax=Fusarium beomiforme TaxID=44412 RepID=A0A9P5DVY7_9HYPO|nr:hypothetical protein FBEOM_6583 [Fusarium beomiforme]
MPSSSRSIDTAFSINPASPLVESPKTSTATAEVERKCRLDPLMDGRNDRGALHVLQATSSVLEVFRAKPKQIWIDHGGPDKAIVRPAATPPRKSQSPRLVMNPPSDQIYYLSHYFDTFVKRNNCNPKTDIFNDVISLMKDQSSGTFLHDAVLSLGAMQAFKFNASDGMNPTKTYKLAVHHYSKSVLGLRQTLDKFDQEPSARHCILWTTHLLGLFELMTDSTGEGWVQHLVHGTSKALIAAGPTACQSGFGQRFFTQIRIFEVCRSIIFNEATFLANADWKYLTDDMLSKSEGGDLSLDELLDIVVSCSTLRVRAINLIYKRDPEYLEHLDDAYDIAQEGFRLRQALIDWEANLAKNSSSKHQVDNNNKSSVDFSSLTKAFFAATSIYLSGVFDYEIPYWQNRGIVAPNLSEEEIQMHVVNILAHTNTVLYNSSISPLLVLFPLRAAGARSWQSWQQDCIMQNLMTIETTFPVAAAFRADLYGVWARMTPPI